MPSDCLQSDTLPELWLKLNGATTSFAQKLKPKQVADELKRFFFANWVVDVNCKVFPAIQFATGKSRVVRRLIACTGRKKGSWRLIIVPKLKIKSRSVRKWPEVWFEWSAFAFFRRLFRHLRSNDILTKADLVSCKIISRFSIFFQKPFHQPQLKTMINNPPQKLIPHCQVCLFKTTRLAGNDFGGIFRRRSMVLANYWFIYLEELLKENCGNELWVEWLEVFVVCIKNLRLSGEIWKTPRKKLGKWSVAWNFFFKEKLKIFQWELAIKFHVFSQDQGFSRPKQLNN